MFEVSESPHFKKFFFDCIVLTIYEPGKSYKTLDNAKAGAERVLDRFLNFALNILALFKDTKTAGFLHQAFKYEKHENQKTKGERK